MSSYGQSTIGSRVYSYTPGPWAWSGAFTELVGAGGVVVLEDFGPEGMHLAYHHEKCNMQDANAALIAAAPDLLEALHKTLACLYVAQPSDDTYDVEGVMDSARVAIRKAYGGNSIALP